MRPKKINLALQGGGAHGAFTWGALDCLLADERIEIAGMSGTSAGALNGAALKAGMLKGGRDGARENLNWLWSQVASSQTTALNQWLTSIGPAGVSQAIGASLPYMMGEAFTRMVSPYALGPFYNNPLRDIVKQFDFDKVCADEGPKLFINATRVRNGKLRVFSAEEVTTDAILASACLPTMFQAVEMFDTETGQTEAFWDGGYTGNPALFPLFDDSLPEDIVVININPLERKDLPTTPQQIQNRLNEISFNSSLLREMRAIDFVQRLLEDGTLMPGRMAQVYTHMIADDALMNDLSIATKSVPNGFIIETLKDAGFAATQAFLDNHFDDLNMRSTLKLRDMFA
ncbi:MAG: NTE family protein [Ascidiaceihabitans sp.]|jgi:NTE family protein